MKRTLLELTQSILSALNSDEVNSISDTPESLQVAECIKTTYYNMLGRYDMPEHNQLFQLTASGSPDTPTLMYVPDGVTQIQWIKYFDTNPDDGNQLQVDQFGAYSTHDVNTDLQSNSNGWSTTSTTTNTIGTGLQTFTVGSDLSISIGDSATAYNGGASMSGTVSSYSSTTLILNITSITGSGTFSAWTIFNGGSLPVGPGYKTVRVITIEEFIRMVSTFNPQEDDVESFQLSIINNDTNLSQNFTFYYQNDIQPRHCCILDNHYVVFDSYDNTQDSTLQSSKTMAYGWVYPQWQTVDTYIPVLDDQRFPLLLNEAKSLAFQEIKQTPHPKAEKEAQRQIASYQKDKSVSGKPTYFQQLPDFGRRGGGWSGDWAYRRRFDGGI